jgi:amino acid adenylation domain-containing protein
MDFPEPLDDELAALACWLLVLDRAYGRGTVGIVLAAGWLELSVYRERTIADWIEQVRAARGQSLAEVPADAEFAWGEQGERMAPLAVLIETATGGQIRARLRSPEQDDGLAAALLSMWSIVVATPRTRLIADIAWTEATASGIVRSAVWRIDGPLDLPSRFASVVRHHHDSVAVVDTDRSWSYGEIATQAETIARALIERGVRPGDIVAVALPRGARAVATMLGIVQIGAGYLPLDLEHPSERLRFMIEDAGVRLIATDAAGRARQSALGVSMIDLGILPSGCPNELPAIDGETTAYVMFTSGSTGRPKGVAITHRAITRLVVDSHFWRLDAGTVMLHATPLGFDPSTLEIWGALLNGGRLVVHGEVIPTGPGLAARIKAHGVTNAWLTTSLFNAVIDDDPSHLAGLATLMIGGEALSVDHVRRFLAAVPSTLLVNGYGPTETCYTTTHAIEPKALANARSVPIGRPINATALYILNARGEPVPRGVPGELHIGGIGVGKGYVNRDDLTAERFLFDPFAADGSRMYRTGDHVRVLPDGAVDFIGRIDGQVKIRGFRIELGEIQSAILQSGNVRSAAVVAHKEPGRDTVLAAYVVASDDHFSASELRRALADKLPDYMVPTFVTRLPALPVTLNGKLDKKALPKPRRERPEELAQPFVTPRPGAERDIAEVFANVLGMERVGALDNFFDLGGNSLLALRAHAAIRNAGHYAVKIAQLYADPTPRGVARSLSGMTAPARMVKRDSAAGQEPVAIIGMAVRLPGAPDVESFWQLLTEGREAIRFFDPSELDASIPAELVADQNYVPARGVIDDADRFDAAFFGIAPNEAELMDPQQRVFLELAWSCLENAGQVPEKTAGTIGVYAGMHNASYFQNHVSAHPDKVVRLGAFQVMLANEKDYIATRTAHKLNLTGPAVSVHTACSTSLVAIAQAFTALRAGQCDLALAGGASITCPANSGYLHQEGAMLSPDGHTRTFDAEGRGTVFSDGAASVLLKRLSDAIADGNTIHAVIRAVAVNNDGGDKASFAAPSVRGQATVISAALADAGVDARSISYVEAHGTATPLGDPVEIAALTQAYREQTADIGFCSIGSVKSNFGHTVVAAGAAGLIKTALALSREELPPTLNFTSPNPKLDIAASPFVVQAERRAWPRCETPRRAGVSSFGVGGTNAHAVLEEAPPAARPLPAEGPQLLRISARTATALEATVDRLAAHLELHPEQDLADVAYTLANGRRDFMHRTFVVADTTADSVSGLRDPAGARARARPLSAAEPHVVLMFPGQGAQYAGMGRELHDRHPVFRRAIEDCFEALAGHTGFDLRAAMFGDDPAALLRTEVTQPAIFALEYALARTWLAHGIEPAVMVGHSVGEFVAATLAGVMRCEDAARLVAKRGALMQAMPPGAMLSVRMGAVELEPLLPQGLQLAAENGPQACVVAGPDRDIDAFAASLEAKGHVARRLQTSHAFHCAMMDPALPELEAASRRIALSAPAAKIVSTLTGRPMTADEATSPTYWARHMREPVRFSPAVRTILADHPSPVFLEAGPRAMLCALVRQHRDGKAVPTAVASLKDEAAKEAGALMEASGALWMAGCESSLTAWPAEGRRRIALPTYPFERKRHWVETLPHAAVARPARLEVVAVTRPASAIAIPTPASTHSSASLATGMDTMTASSASAASGGRCDRLIVRLRSLFEDVCGVEFDDAEPGRSFVELGLDSLALTQVALALKKEFSVAITFRQLMESHTTFEALSAHLDAQLPPEAVTQPVPLAASQPVMSPPVPAIQTPPTSRHFDAPAGAIQSLIQQQLAVMAQQLALLQGQPASAGLRISAPTAPCAEVAPIPPVEVSKISPAAAANPTPATADEEASALTQKTYDVKKAFGAIARIHTSSTELSERQRARLDAFMKRYIKKTERSKQYTSAHRKHLADPRVVNGFRPALKEIIYQIVVERSKGVRMWDLDGNEYVDALSGFGMSMFGWQPDFVLDAVRQQIDSGYDIGPQHPLAGVVAELFCKITGADRAALCNTGSEAVMGCVRVARTVTGRSKIAIFAGSYHGIFDEVIVRGTKKLKSVPAAPGILPNTAENVVVLDYGTQETLQWLKDNASDLAAVLVEPVQSRRPDFQPREFLREVRKLTEKSGALLIFDEVITGFRCHPGGTQALFGIRADLASYGKVVGGGFPIGVIAGKREFMDALDGGHWEYGDDSIPTVGVTYFAGTFVRHPLALVAAKAVLEHIDREGPALQQGLTDRTTAMVDELNAYCREHGAPIALKSFSSVWKIFFEEEHPLQDLLFAMMRNRGVHILDNFPCFLTTAHTPADIAVIKTAFKEAVAELQEADFLPRRASAKVISFDASRPPIPGARLGRDADGKPAWFVANPDAPGKYMKVEV